MSWIAVAIATVLALLIGALWVFQRSLIYFPDRSAPPPAGELLPGASDVTLTTSDGLKLGVWHLPAPERCAATVLLAPGNGGNRAGRAELARRIGDRGLGVLAMDYRGYGGNAGTPTQAGLARDVRAASDYLTGEAEVPADSLVYLGESIGAAVVAELATERPPAAMVLRSPFTSLAEVARATYGVPLGWLLREQHPVQEYVQHSHVPIGVVYGGDDTIVPPAQSREVARAARAAGNEVVEVEVAGADHNEATLAHGRELLDMLDTLAERGGANTCD